MTEGKVIKQRLHQLSMAVDELAKEFERIYPQYEEIATIAVKSFPDSIEEQTKRIFEMWHILNHERGIS